MSSKKKTAATKEDGKPALVPKLRFPEFREDAGWTAETLENALAMSATYGIVTAGEFQERGIPMLRGGDIKEGRIGDGLPFVTAEISSQYRRTILQANDVVISLVGYPGEAAVVPPRYVGANISRAVGLLRVKHVLSAPFLVCYLNSPAGKRTVLKPSAGSAQVVVNLKQLNALLIPAPTPAEQQKIAECLSSVDELMAAQARKVDALKTHKKGLMQQLFPREGETQPRLRFPEFQNAGEWEKDKLGSVCELYQPVTLTASDLTMTGEYLVYGANGIIGSHNAYNHEESELAVTCRGATCGEVTITKPKSWVTGNAMIVKPRTKKLRKDFIFHYFKNHGLKAIISGSAQPQITRTGFAPLVVFFPASPEQQRIADCLTSLDDLLAAQTQKLAALKTHKQGLMQQLFPSPEGMP